MTHLALIPSRVECRDLAAQGNLIPIYTEFIADCATPIAVFEKIDNGRRSFLLESAESTDFVGRYSFLGSDPQLYFESRGRTILIENADGSRKEYTTEADPLTELAQIMARFRFVPIPDLPPFAGGAVGYIGFDCVRFFEPTVGEPPPDELNVPDSVFLVTDTYLVFDHRQRRLKIVANAWIENGDVDLAYDRAAEKIRILFAKLEFSSHNRFMNTAPVASSLKPASNTSREEFYEMVRRGKDHIAAGNIFQMVPSQRFRSDYRGDPLALYRALRFINPSPYMFCLRLDKEFALVGSSPEVHVRSVAGEVEIRPLAGTRPRGVNPEADQKLAAELLADPKERAEHLMLVDLARNDLGRICQFGTVRVTDFMSIERYSHVMHIVSDVIGRLRPGQSAFDVMRATFPAGTVSGAPKVRAMQLINELEKNKRNVYSGAIGYFGFDGNLDSCIALRTIVLKDKVAYVQAGGGLVADSTPEGEYEESVNKAMAMFRALERAEAIL
jgi:anthranilate synthase component I